MTFAASPLRYPDPASTPLMTRRGWWLVVLNVLIPGSAQVLAGNRRLGRFGLGATLAMWVLAVLAIAGLLWARDTLLGVMANSVALAAVAIVAGFYCLLWLVLTLDTLRLVRLVRVAPGARGLLPIVAATLLVLGSGSAAYAAYFATTASGFLSSVFVAGPSEPPIDGRYNILLLGGDSGPDREGMRPDSTTVLSIDAETGQAVLIGLPRDLTDIPFPDGSPLAAVYPEGYGSIDGCEVDVCQLNSIYTEVELKSPEMYPDATSEGSQPGIEGMRDAAEGVTGLEIQYYGLIDMQGFEALIDALGGVDIEVTERIPKGGDVDEYGDIVGTDAWIEPGLQHMDGNTALWYARARHGSSDYDRMLRQRQLQDAMLQQFEPLNVLAKFEAVANASADTVRTDIPQGMLGYFVGLSQKTKELPLVKVELTPEGGIDPEAPDWDLIHSMVAQAVAPPASEAPAG